MTTFPTPPLLLPAPTTAHMTHRGNGKRRIRVPCPHPPPLNTTCAPLLSDPKPLEPPLRVACSAITRYVPKQRGTRVQNAFCRPNPCWKMTLGSREWAWRHTWRGRNGGVAQVGSSYRGSRQKPRNGWELKGHTTWAIQPGCRSHMWAVVSRTGGELYLKMTSALGLVDLGREQGR